MNKNKIKEISTTIHQFLRSWHQPSSENSKFYGYEMKPLLESALVELENVDSFSKDLLVKRFIGRKSIAEIAQSNNFSQDQINRKQAKAINDLAIIASNRVSQSTKEMEQRKLFSLPPARFDRLFGADSHIAQLKKKILDPNANWIMAITGLGGIGKSALLNATLIELANVPLFEDYLWLRMEPIDLEWLHEKEDHFWDQFTQRLANAFLPEIRRTSNWQYQLAETLRESPRIIVIDNMEEQIVPPSFALRLEQFVRPSKIILTSRAKMPLNSNITQISLGEIEKDLANLLIQERIIIVNKDISNTELTQLSDSIYQVTGGNPLAIRLAAGLNRGLPLDRITHSFSKIAGSKTEAMYRFIYEQSWNSLSKSGRKLLQGMPLVGSFGAKYDQLFEIGGLSEATPDEEIQVLLERSLIEMQGSKLDPHFGIHVLTDSFLQNDILNWIQ
jgi:hypothetical protein